MSGAFEIKETAIVRSILSDSDVFINVGANLGIYCAHALSANKTCVAFEPHPENVAMLLQNLQANGWDAEVHAAACGAKPAILELYGGGTAASLVKGWAGMPSAHPLLVPIIRLDDVISNRFSEQRILCLVDVEGAELEVLKGAVNLINRNHKPIWLIEVCIDVHFATPDGRNPNLKPTFKMFYDAGYRAFSVEDDFREVLMEEIECIAEGGANTILGHNFIFSDKEMDFIKMK